MPNVTTIQENFNGGEISPLLYGRVAVPRYKESLALCQNYIPLIQGPITRRPGTAFVAPVKDSTAVTRLIPFEVSTTQSFMLEFGNQYIRVFQNNGVYNAGAVPAVITGITKANPAVITSVNSYNNGDSVLLSGVSGMTQFNNTEVVVANATGTTFQAQGIDSTLFDAYVSGGTATKIYEITVAIDSGGLGNLASMPYVTSDLSLLQFTQSNDVLYIAHPKHAPFKLTFDGSTNFTLQKIAIQDGPYYPVTTDVNGNSATLTTGGSISGGLLAVGSGGSTSGINGGAGFSSLDVGRLIRMKQSTTWFWARIASVSNTTNINIQSIMPTSTLPAVSTASTVWQLGVWSDRDGWPTAVEFHQDRLVFGGPGGQPFGFYGSNAADYENFSPTDSAGTITAARAYSFVLNTRDLNAIKWITSDEQGMLIGTSSTEWRVGAADSTSALSALSVSAKKSTSVGSDAVQAVQSGKCTLFVQKGSRKLREINYYFDVNGFRSADITQMAEHITSSGISFLAVQKTPQPIVWAVRKDGVLLSMTYERELDALKVGWSRHVIGGTNSAVESVAVISSADGTSQDVWFIVKRTVNGQTVRHIEYLTQLFDNTTLLKNAVFVDASLTYNGTPTNTLSGINHLNGQTVSILADGSVQSDRVVINGKITLDSLASVITIGLSYNSDGQKLRTDAGSADGSAMGKNRRTHRVGIMLLNTLGFKLGPDFNTLDDITLDSSDAGFFGQSQALFSGICTQLLTTTYDFDNMFCWRQSQPLPGTIQGFYPQQVTQDRS